MPRVFVSLSLIAWLSFATEPRVEGQAPFTEEAGVRGISFFLYTGTVGAGRGMAVNDLDGDGDLDLVMTGSITGDVALYENSGAGNFVPRTGLDFTPSSSFNGVNAVDYDADGDLDLYLTNYTGTNVLARNEGNFVFSDVSIEAEVNDPGHSVGCSWGDYDNDGWIDLYVANYDVYLIETNRFFRNRGDGTFEDVTFSFAPGIADAGTSLQPTFLDYDRDGDVDLHVGNDKGFSLSFVSRLWRNDNGTFTDVSTTSGAGVIADAMGVGHGDPNRDGYLDFCITNTPPAGDNILLLNQQDGTFANMSAEYGIQYCQVGWACEFFDFDHDMYEDALILDGSSDIPTLLYHGSPTPPLEEIGTTVGLTTYQTSYCATPGDIDGDGDLDILVSSTNWPLELYINHEGQTRNWLQIRLDSSTHNRRAIGALVDVVAGGVSQTRAVFSQGSYKNSLPYVLHYGLGDESTVESITVHWPGGAVSEHGPFDANQLITIDDSTAVTPEPSFIRGDANSDGTFDIADPVLMLSHLFLAEPVVCLRALDTNEDDALDVADAVYSLAALFGFGAPVGAPHPGCGEESGGLECAAYSACP